MDSSCCCLLTQPETLSSPEAVVSTPNKSSHDLPKEESRKEWFWTPTSTALSRHRSAAARPARQEPPTNSDRGNDERNDKASHCLTEEACQNNGNDIPPPPCSDQNDNDHVNNKNNDNRDDGCSSSSSSSSSDSFSDNNVDDHDDDNDESVPELTSMQIRAQRIARNQAFLESLGLGSGFGLGHSPKNKAKTKRHRTHETSQETKEAAQLVPKITKRGMLLLLRPDTTPAGCYTPTLPSATKAVPATLPWTDLLTRFPFREAPIKRLIGLLTPSVISATASWSPTLHPTAAPTPIFVTGPSGTGKTAIVRSVVDVLSQQCGGAASNNDHSTSTHSTNNHKNNHNRALFSSYVNCSTVDSIEEALQSTFRQLQTVIQTKTRTRTGRNEALTGSESLSKSLQTSSKGVDSQHRSTGTNRSHLSRSVAAASNKRTSQATTATEVELSAELRAFASSTAVWQFGKDLARLLSTTSHGYGAVLVLDQAECLMSLAMKKSGIEWSNVLAELLLLPRTFRLNMTIVVVTNSYLLQHTRT